MRRLTSAILLAALVGPILASAPAAAVPARQIAYTQWDSGTQLRTGTGSGVRVAADRLTLAAGATTGSWLSPWTGPGFALTSLVASWSATTPQDGWIQVEVRGRAGSRTSSWDTLARWAADDEFVPRATESGQADDLGSVDVDTWVVPNGVTSYQLRVTMN